MSPFAKTIVFVPLHEEMTHINAMLERRGAMSLVPFDARKTRHTYLYTRPTQEEGEIHFRVLGDMGNTRTAAIVGAELAKQKPDVAILTGMAGSLDPKLAKLGDVFVSDTAKYFYADKIKEFDHKVEILTSQITDATSEGDVRTALAVVDDRKRIMGDSYLRFRRDVVSAEHGGMGAASYVRTLRRREGPALDPVSDELVASLEPAERIRCVNTNPAIRDGVVMASEMVVDSQTYIDFLHERNKDENAGWYATEAAATDRRSEKDRREFIDRNPWLKGDIPIVDTESYGFFKLIDEMRLAGTLSVKAFAVRGVSDLAARKGDLERESKELIRNVAARNAAAVTVDLIFALELAELGGRR